MADQVVKTIHSNLHTQQEIQIAWYSRKQAFEYIKKSNFGRALAHLFVALRLFPEWREELRDVFWQALNVGCSQLANEGKLEETISLRKDALLIYPEDEVILLDLGSIYFKLNDTDQSLEYYRRALQARPSFLPASRAIQSIYNKYIERWHFRMLNDCNRNKAYHQAISHRVHEGYTSVLDIGTGTGLLSLFAAEEGAEDIWACESNSFMYRTAQSVLAANSISHRVTLLNKHSDCLTVPTDIPQKVSMIITEVFDAGLLGEGILPVLLHAWENLLLPSSSPEYMGSSKRENGIVVPYSATVWVAAIQCIDIARRHRLLPQTCLCSRSEDAILFKSDKSLCIDFGQTELCKLCEAPLHTDFEDISYDLDGISIACNLSEPYTTEDLENVAHGYEMLSKPYKVLEINFNNLEELKAYGLKRQKEEIVHILTDSAGSVDAIASWFHLNLDNNGTIISTAPFKEDGLHKSYCWHQAIFPSFLSKKVSSGDVIELHIDTSDGVLRIPEMRIACPERISTSMPVLLVSDQIVSFLNNKTWINAFNATAVKLLNDFSGSPTKKILDLNPFPVLGFRMLKGGNSMWKLSAKAETKKDEEYIIAVAKYNSIDETQIQFVSSATLEKNIEHEVFDVICMDIVDSTGELREDITHLAPLLSGKLSVNGAIVPSAISIESQLIECDKLAKESKVLSDDSMRNFIIREFINSFSVDYHLDIPYHGIEFKALSNHHEVLKLSVNSSEPNSICAEHRQELSISTTGNGTVTGIIYWVNLYLQPEMEPISSACFDSHCNQAAFLSCLKVKADMAVTLKCHFWYGLFDIKLSSKANTV